MLEQVISPRPVLANMLINKLDVVDFEAIMKKGLCYSVASFLHVSHASICLLVLT